MSRVFPFRKLGKKGKSHWYDKIGISYAMNTKNDITITDSLLFTKQAFANFRNGMKHTIPISTSVKVLKHFTLTPSVSLTERWYLSQIQKSWDGDFVITDTLHKFTRGHDYSFSTGLNTKIYGMVQFPKSKIAAIRHVITPNLSFRYQPDFSDEKYGYYKSVQSDTNGSFQEYSIIQNGIFGRPSQAKSGNITFSLSNIFEMKTRSKKDTVESFKKIKLLESFNISSSYNIFADSLNLNDISLNARTRLLDIFDITFSSRYDPYTSNKEQTKNINQFELNANNRLARLTTLNTSIGLTLNDKSFASQKKEEEEEEEEEEERDFYSIPWN
jgi:hypothetical protein